MPMRKIAGGALAAAAFSLAALLPSPLHAQDYPSRPVKVVVPFSPGGAVDGPMRVIAVVTSPTREQLEAIRRPGAGFVVRKERSRAPPVGQLRLPFMRRAA